MDSLCFICYEDGGTMIDPHWSPWTFPKPKHVFHAECLEIWERVSAKPVSHCPYCRNLLSPYLGFWIKAAERKQVIAAIRAKKLELLKSILSGHKKLDDESRHIYLVEATIAGESSFLEFIEEKYSLPYEDLIPFLAITFSMKNRELFDWYRKSYKKNQRYYSCYTQHNFQCQVFVAADMAKRKWLSRWLLFKFAFTCEVFHHLPKNSILYATKFGRSKSTLKEACSIVGLYGENEEYVKHIVPQVVTDENGWKQSYWFRNSKFTSSPEVLSIGLVLAVEAANWKAFKKFLRITDHCAMSGRFKTIDVQHLFSLRFKRSGHKIFRKLCIKKLVDLEDLRRNKMHLCKLSYQASNEELMKYYLSVLQECLTGKEIEEIIL